jgi:hypothetical protein
MIKKVLVNFDFAKVLSGDYSVKSSCIKHQVTELTDIHKQYGEFPKTYCFQNTLIHQLWWGEDQLDFDDLGKQLGIEVITVSSILQPPGSTIPLHRDTFYQITTRYPDRSEIKVRANIFLEDYKLGHFIQYQNKDSIISVTDWRAGQGFLWDSSILHLGANNGMQNKYTLQVSGFLK